MSFMHQFLKRHTHKRGYPHFQNSESVTSNRNVFNTVCGRPEPGYMLHIGDASTAQGSGEWPEGWHSTPSAEPGPA